MTITKELIGETILEMVEIPGGTFLMGSPYRERGRTEHEGPQHQVTVQSFSMGKYPVTQNQWRAIARLSPIEIDLFPSPASLAGADLVGENYPVVNISWSEAIEFCARLSQLTGKPYRLPSEAEWEYACRASTTTPYYCGQTLTNSTGNCRSNQLKNFERIRAVDKFPGTENNFGLCDMHGNTWEWCLDHWHKNYEGAPIDGSAWLTDGFEIYQVIRGGAWLYHSGQCRSATRHFCTPESATTTIGFRVVY